MKRLFQVNGLFFESKMEAKAYRNTLNRKDGAPGKAAAFGSDESTDKYTVSYGPDHIGPHGHKHNQHWRKS